MILAEGRLDAVTHLFLCQEVDVGPSGGKASQVAPGGAGPLDVGFVVFGVLPRGRYIKYKFGVAVTHRGVIFRETIEGPVKRKKDHS